MTHQESDNETLESFTPIADTNGEITPIQQTSSHRGPNEVGTPKALITMLVDALETTHFGIDPASGSQPIQIAETQLEKEDNGLQTSWAIPGSSVYLNPPYANPSPWLQRLTHFVDPGDETTLDFGVAVLKADPSTSWFADFVSKATALCFPDRRIAFYDPATGEQMDTAPWPVVIAPFGDPPQSIPKTLASGCETGLFDSCTIFTPVAPTEIRGQQTLTDLLTDGGIPVHEAASKSPYWAEKPPSGYATDQTWYLTTPRQTAIRSPHTQTQSR